MDFLGVRGLPGGLLLGGLAGEELGKPSRAIWRQR